MARTALVIMAAGIGSRFGGGIKQLTPFGASGELMIDFSIYDALEAGFDEIVFVIRRDLEAEFRAVIGDRIARIAPVHYVFQEKPELPAGFSCPPGRVKPWGTGQAVWACRTAVTSPFAVINADDYYGKSALRLLHEQLCRPAQPGEICMAGFLLRNTLSDFGGVTRGVCTVEDGLLRRVEETYHIEKRPGGAVSVQADGSERPLQLDSCVSMNIWGFQPGIFPLLEREFTAFLRENLHSQKEFVLPTVIDGLIQSGEASVRVLQSMDEWFGVTYREDVPSVRAAFAELLRRGVYPQRLFEDQI